MKTVLKYGLKVDGSLGYKYVDLYDSPIDPALSELYSALNVSRESLDITLESHPLTAFTQIDTVSESHGEITTKFDWWQVSFEPSHFDHWEKSTGEVIPPMDFFRELVGKHYPDASWSLSAGRNGYSDLAVLSIGDRRIMSLMWGGSHELANVTVSGSETNAVRDYLVGILPQFNRVSRVDSAFDSRSGTAAFQSITQWAVERASQAGINCTWIKNSDSSKGDTLYIGSKTSRVQIRIYEKGKQAGYLPDEWWRAEIQYRPRSGEKKGVYSLSSGAIWGASTFSRELMAELTGKRLACLDVGYVPKERDLEHRLLQMSIQYGNLLAEALAIHGSPAAVFEVCDRALVQVGKPSITGRFPDVPVCPF